MKHMTYSTAQCWSIFYMLWIRTLLCFPVRGKVRSTQDKSLKLCIQYSVTGPNQEQYFQVILSKPSQLFSSLKMVITWTKYGCQYKIMFYYSLFKTIIVLRILNYYLKRWSHFFFFSFIFQYPFHNMFFGCPHRIIFLTMNNRTNGCSNILMW